ncbi:COG4315 family predicted lipoprotein [Kitasatospora sp. NPDC004272]
MPRTRRAAAAVLSLSVLSAAACAAPADLNAPPATDSPSVAAPSASSGPSASTFASSTGTRVALASVGSLGPVLVDAQGRTLYLYGADNSVHAGCLDECAKSWPPVTTPGFPLAGPGVDDGLLGAAALPDGTAQVLYKGHPLYRYTGDRAPGEAAGHTVADPRGTFYAVTSLGDPVGVDIATLRGTGGAVPGGGASAGSSAAASAPAQDPATPADPGARATAQDPTPAPAVQAPEPAVQAPVEVPVQVPPAEAPAQAPADEAPAQAPADGAPAGTDGSQEG